MVARARAIIDARGQVTTQMERSATQLVSGLSVHGFDEVPARGRVTHLRRTVGRRDDHVRITMDGSWWQRWWTTGPVTVALGTVFSMVEQSFSRRIPVSPNIPADVHLATTLGELAATEDSVNGNPVAAIVQWCDRFEHPAAALQAGLPTDPMLALEFAVVARDVASGEVAAATVLAGLGDDGFDASRLRQRVEIARARLP